MAKEFDEVPEFLFQYRMPKGYRPGGAAMVAAWNAWFGSIGKDLIDRGKPVVESRSLGNCGPETRPGGYTVITADSLEAALEVANGCPALSEGAGVEVSPVVEFAPAK